MNGIMKREKLIFTKKNLLFFGIVAMGLVLYSCASLMNNTSAVFSIIAVPEEGGINFVKITEDADAVANPGVRVQRMASTNSTRVNIEWWINPVIAVSPDGGRIAYVNYKNKMSNVMVKSATSGGSSIQRTFRNFITDFSWSPDGNKFCFTENRNNRSGIYTVNAEQGSVIQQISQGMANDYAPVMTKDGKKIFFHRGEGYDNYSLWSYDLEKNLFSNYSRGMTPCLVPDDPNILFCSRYTTNKECEIWKLNIETGVEEVLLSQPGKSFTTPQISPDGRWILCTGSSVTPDNISNTDIFVIQVDGSRFTQLTYHPGNDMSAVWAPDGKSIYFVSQRGATDAKTFNVWKMDFNL